MGNQALLSADALSQRLGVKRGYVFQNYKRLGIPYYKIGNLLRFDPAEVDEWLKKCQKGLEAKAPCLPLGTSGVVLREVQKTSRPCGALV